MVNEDEVTSAENHVDIGRKDVKESEGPNSGQHIEYGVDHEEKQIAGQVNQLPDLQRKLKSRHLSMIAIGKATSALLNEVCENVSLT